MFPWSIYPLCVEAILLRHVLKATPILHALQPNRGKHTFLQGYKMKCALIVALARKISYTHIRHIRQMPHFFCLFLMPSLLASSCIHGELKDLTVRLKHRVVNAKIEWYFPHFKQWTEACPLIIGWSQCYTWELLSSSN